jgi:hypothetical protein
MPNDAFEFLAYLSGVVVLFAAFTNFITYAETVHHLNSIERNKGRNEAMKEAFSSEQYFLCANRIQKIFDRVFYQGEMLALGHYLKKSYQ